MRVPALRRAGWSPVHRDLSVAHRAVFSVVVAHKLASSLSVLHTNPARGRMKICLYPPTLVAEQQVYRRGVNA
jgi:hypothetical protein